MVLPHREGAAVVSHAAAVNRLLALQECGRLRSDDRLLWTGPPGAEAQPFGALWPFLMGATLVLPDAGPDVIPRVGVTAVHPDAASAAGPLATATWHDNVRTVLVSGAALDTAALRPAGDPGSRLVTLYADEIAGYVAGRLGRPAATTVRFVAGPYDPPGDRMYRTGLVARWGADGVLDLAPGDADPRPAASPGRGAAAHSPGEGVLSALFAEVLGRPSVGAAESFFDLGGHSLLAIRLVERIRRETGIEVPVQALFRTPTAAGLAASMDDGTYRNSLDVVLPLRVTGDEPPLFCVHPASGISWVYAGLQRHLPPDRPLYGLQAPGLAQPGRMPGSVEATAADLLAQMRTVQPSGPYHLLGWSYGALVAQQLATSLRAAGEHVGTLALLDGYPGSHPPHAAVAHDDPRLLGALLRSLGYRTEGLPTPLSYPDFQALLTTESGPLAGLAAENFLALAKVYANNVMMMGSFRPAPFDGDALLFVATADKTADSPTAADWHPYIHGRLEVHQIDCDHGRLTAPGPLAEVGAVLARHLRLPPEARQISRPVRQRS
jgi:thioesterase domain-containing protein